MRAPLPSLTSLVFVIGALAGSAGVAEAAGRTIVGEWAPDPRNCLPHAGAIRISALMLAADELVCDFRSVARTGDQVTWRGSCHDGNEPRPATVVATLLGERLSVRINDQPADTYRRCRR